MHISHQNSKQESWNKVNSFNYKLPHLKKSVVYAEVSGEHGEVETGDSEWMYYIIDGSGKFIINGETSEVNSGDVITVPAKTTYNYFSAENAVLKVVMFIDLWEN